MAKRSREVSVFSLSFLDVLSCGLGAVIILLLISFQVVESAEDEREDVEGLEARLEEARKEREERDRRTAEWKRLIQEGEKLDREVRELSLIRFAGIATGKRNILILVDLSGSMEPRKRSLTSLVQGLVQLLPEKSHRFNVLGFLGKDRDGNPDRFPAWREDGRLHFVTQEGRHSALGFAAAMIRKYVRPSEAGTPTEEALDRALAYPEVEAVFLVTDGAPDSCFAKDEEGKWAPDAGKLEAFVERVTRKNTRGVEIHSFGIGPKLYEDEVFRTFLKKLAKRNGRGGFAAF